MAGAGEHTEAGDPLEAAAAVEAARAAGADADAGAETAAEQVVAERRTSVVSNATRWVTMPTSARTQSSSITPSRLTHLLQADKNNKTHSHKRSSNKPSKHNPHSKHNN